jgi:hypothetical protein
MLAEADNLLPYDTSYQQPPVTSSQLLALKNGSLSSSWASYETIFNCQVFFWFLRTFDDGK